MDDRSQEVVNSEEVEATHENLDAYASYQGMMSDVVSALSGIEKISGSLELHETCKSLSASRKKLRNHHFSVGIMGEFKRGKSTVINSLLEREIMPSDIMPCSATMNRVTYDTEAHVKLKMMDGSVKPIGIDELIDYVTKLTKENESRASEVREAIVYYPCRFCQNGVDIIDTPGLNDDERMNQICEEIIPELDAVIMVIVPGSPFSMSEAEFVRNKLMTSDLSRLIFLVNKIDVVRGEESRAKIVAGIKAKIQETVLEKIASMYGEDSEQYDNAKMKLGNIRIFPFSALDALEGKQAGDVDLIAKSGTKKFEEALTKILTEERGAIEIGTSLSVLQRAVLEIKKAIDSRKSAMSMSAGEFEQKKQHALEQLDQIREQKKNEKNRLKARAKEVQMDLSDRAMKFYSEVEQKMLSVVEDFNPDPTTFADTAGQTQGATTLQNLIVKTTNNAVNEFTQKIIAELQDIVISEAETSADFTAKVSEQINSVLSAATGIKSSDLIDSGDFMATGLDVITDFMGITGIGGLVAGYRVAGVKGALVGGGAGLAVNIAVGILLTSLSVSFLPMTIISCAVGTIVGKKIPTMIFRRGIGQERLNAIKNAARTNISEAVRTMLLNRDLEKWINGLVNERFSELINAMEAECDKMLSDTESSMAQIHKDLILHRVEREQTLQFLDSAEENCRGILESLKPVCEKVEAALKNE